MQRRRGRDDDRSDDRPERGQVILIGAIALAFIVLGVVVVFNGLVYTETLSSGDSGQSASQADRAELEVEQSVACLAATEDDDLNISAYADLYRNATAHSGPTVVDVSSDSDITGEDLFDDGVDVTVTYETNDVSHERTMNVTADQCPRRPTGELDNARSEGDGEYAVNWSARSSGSDLSRVNVSLIHPDEGVVDENETTTEDFGDDRNASGEEVLEWDGDADDDGDVSHFKIVVRNEDGYEAIDTKDIP